MTKIKEIVRINSGYASYVDLYPEYYDLEKNRGRMKRYQPIAAHRSVFEKVANALNSKDRRFYFLSGSYGTGKSHLLLMLANYFAQPSDVSEIKSFFANYETAQKEVKLREGEELNERKAASLSEARKSGRYLIAICRYDLNLDFEGVLLRALQDSLQREESKFILDTHYQEAIRRIDDWEIRKLEDRFYKEFETTLGNKYPDWTINSLRKDLNEFKEESLDVFKDCFRQVTDSDFSYKKDNLRDIITDLLQNKGFKEIFKGIVFIYDEFGSAIDKGLIDYRTMLGFAQFCADSTLDKGGSVIFLGSGHKSFSSHGQLGDLNAETLEARVTEIGVVTQGMEDIISAIVQPQKESTLWKENVNKYSPIFTWFSGECKRLDLFNWLPAPKIKNNIIENIYPMHPLATFALLRLANEAGSANRSVFKFFSPEFQTVEPYSFPWFVENNEIVQNNKLNLYTADLLVEYFQASLKADNSRLLENVRKAVVNYEATLRELNAYTTRQGQGLLFEDVDELMKRILKIMLVNEISSNHEVTLINSKDNIHFGLNAISEEDKNAINDRLRLMCEAGVLYRNENNIYELIPGDRKDIKRMIDSYKTNPDNKPTNILQRFLELVPLSSNESFMEANNYNSPYNEDKRLKILFATPTILSEKYPTNGEEQHFFQYLENERQNVIDGFSSYEGTAVYVFCENELDINNAKKAIVKNDQKRAACAIPHNPINVYDAIFTLKALNSDLFKKQSEEFNPYEKAEEKTIRDDALKILREAKNQYFSNDKVDWFGIKGQAIPLKENIQHDVANWMMTELYAKTRNTFAHMNFNKIHTRLSGQVKSIFDEAGDILCPLLEPITVNWSWPENRGGTRYLRKCFVDNQLLEIKQIEGDIRYLVPEKNSKKFSKAIPAYEYLITELAKLEGNGPKNPKAILDILNEEYGQGEIAVTLLMLLARRFYGDSLRFKKEPNNLTDMQFERTDDMLDLVQGKYPSSVIIFEPVSKEDQAYFQIIHQVFNTEAVEAGKTYTIGEANQSISDWWSTLPIIARSSAFFSEDFKTLAETISQASVKDPYLLIKNDLLVSLGFESKEMLSKEKLLGIEKKLKEFKTKTENIQNDIETELLNGFARIFSAQSKLDVDIQAALKAWYTRLSSAQKDPLGSYHNNDSKPLIKYPNYVNIEELLNSTLPEAYGYGKVEDWTNNHISEYLDRIEKGKDQIENNAPKVSALVLNYQDHLKEENDQVFFKGEMKIIVSTDDGNGIIYFTDNGSDPIESKQRKKLEPGETLLISENMKIKIVVSDEIGNYSAIKTVEAINDLEKYKIQRSEQPGAFEETVMFVFPKDKEAAKVTISSLITCLKGSGYFKNDELEKIIIEALGKNKEK